MQMLSTYGLSHLVRLVLANRLFVAGGKLPERPMWTYLNSGGDEKVNVRPKTVRGQKKNDKVALTVRCAGGLRPYTELLLNYKYDSIDDEKQIKKTAALQPINYTSSNSGSGIASSSSSAFASGLGLRLGVGTGSDSGSGSGFDVFDFGSDSTSASASVEPLVVDGAGRLKKRFRRLQQLPPADRPIDENEDELIFSQTDLLADESPEKYEQQTCQRDTVGQSTKRRRLRN